MVYAERFESDFPQFSGVLGACAGLSFDPMAYADGSGNLIGVNEPLMELFGVTQLEQLAPLSSWFIPVGTALSSLLSQAGSCRGKIETDDTCYDVEVKSEPIAFEGHTLVGIVFRDVTIIERAKAAERYFDHFKKKFLSNMSHEFRTPMNAIIGFSDLLKTTPLNGHQREYVDMTSRSALSMMRNIENLLELMQVESGTVRPRPELFHPLEVYENFSMQFGDLALSKNIQLMFLIDPHLPKTMLGDQDKILSVVRNLIQNGIKFTAEGGRFSSRSSSSTTAEAWSRSSMP